MCNLRKPRSMEAYGWPTLVILVGLGVPGWVPSANGQDSSNSPEVNKQPASQDDSRDHSQRIRLSQRQQVLVQRVEQLEQRLSRLSHLEQGRNQSRSEILKKSHQLAQALELVSNLKKTISLLESGTALDLKTAIASQQKAITDLGKIYQLLASNDPLNSSKAEKQKLRERIDRIQQIIQRQEAVRQRLDAGNVQALKKEQSQIQTKTEQIRGEIENETKGEESTDAATDPLQVEQESSEEKSSEKDSSQNEPHQNEPNKQGGSNKTKSVEKRTPLTTEEKVVDQLRRAEEQMQQIHRELAPEKKEESGTRMDSALEELAKAKQELEKILRQERETEIESTLRSLEDRFKKMLQIQLKINSATKELQSSDKTSSEKNIDAFQLSTQQQKCVLEADRALLLLNEEGSSRAIPGTLNHIKLDMLEIVDRLQLGRIDDATTELQHEIELMLVELIKAVQEEQAEQKKLQQQGPSPTESADQQERPLVQKIAELKIVKQLQLRINSRHQSYVAKIQSKNKSEIARKIRQLGERQKQLESMIRDIVRGAQ